MIFRSLNTTLLIKKYMADIFFKKVKLPRNSQIKDISVYKQNMLIAYKKKKQKKK